MNTDRATIELEPFPVTFSFPLRLYPDPCVWRYDVKADDEGYLTWIRRDAAALPAEFVLRELSDLGDDLRTDTALGFAREWGGVLDRWVGNRSIAPPPAGASNHVTDVVAYLSAARSLTRTWVRWIEGDYTSDAWPDLLAEKQTWPLFAMWLNRGFHEKCRVPFASASTQPPLGVPGSTVVDLYAGCCVQIYNLIQQAEVPLRCENDRCGRAFLRQRGGESTGKYYRTRGVRFCSPRCASAQGQRERRRRRKDESNA